MQGGEQGVKNRLHERGSEKARALFILDIEGEAERLAVIVKQGLERLEVVRQRVLRVTRLSGKYLG